MVYKNIYDKNNTFDYPNYPFPTEYTKSGQSELKEKWLTNNVNQDVVQTNTYIENEPRQTQGGLFGKLNISQLLPLIKAMSSKGKVSTSDMMKTFMPLMTQDTQNLSELISAFDGLNKSNIHKSKIESYTRVENEKSTSD